MSQTVGGEEQVPGVKGQGKEPILNELRTAVLFLGTALASCCLPAGPFEGSRSWQDSLHRRLK